MITIDDIDIYVKTYNRAHLITQTLDSMLNQTIKIKDITVLDNNSSDNTEQVIKRYQKKYKQIKYIKTFNKYGNFLKAQELLKKNNKKYVMTCHDDDLLHPEFFEKILIAINSCKTPPAFAISSVTRFPNADMIAATGKEAFKNPFINRVLPPLRNSFLFIKDSKEMAKFLLICETTHYSEYLISIGSGIYRRDIFSQHVPLNDVYGRLDDIPILISIASKGGGIIVADSNAYYHRCHSVSDNFNPSTANTLRQVLNHISAYSKQFDFKKDIEYLQKIPLMLSNLYYNTSFLKPEYKHYSLNKFIKLCVKLKILPDTIVQHKKNSNSVYLESLKSIEYNLVFKNFVKHIFSIDYRVINQTTYKTLVVFGKVIKLKKCL